MMGGDRLDKSKLTGRPKCGVLQIGEKGPMPYDSADVIAEEYKLCVDTVYRWIGDGKAHQGFKWEWEPEKP
jgi:hypothetical protein